MSRLESWLATDRVTRILGAFTVVLMVSMLVLAVITIPQIVSNTEASRRTDDLATCRAQFASAVDDAFVQAFEAFGDVQAALGSGLVAAIRQDPTQLALVAAEVETTQQAQAEAIDALAEASDRRAAAVDLSKSDPDEFLRECEAEP